KDVAALSKATQAAPRGVRALVDVLTSIDLLKREGDTYALAAESSTFLVSARPAYIGRYFTHTTTMILPWLKLTESVVSGKPAASINKQQDGAGFFSDFVESLFVLNYPAANGLARTLLAGQPRKLKVLDVAAGSGVW